VFIMASEEHLSDAPEVLPEGPQGDDKVDPKENYPKESGDARHFLEQQLARVKAQQSLDCFLTSACVVCSKLQTSLGQIS